MSDWLYAVDGEQNGPISSKELRNLAEAGQLGADDLVWKDGLKNWVPAKCVRGLFPQESTQRPISEHVDIPAIDDVGTEDPASQVECRLSNPNHEPSQLGAAKSQSGQRMNDELQFLKRQNLSLKLALVGAFALGFTCSIIMSKLLGEAEAKTIEFGGDAFDRGMESLEDNTERTIRGN